MKAAIVSLHKFSKSYINYSISHGLILLKMIGVTLVRIIPWLTLSRRSKHFYATTMNYNDSPDF